MSGTFRLCGIFCSFAHSSTDEIVTPHQTTLLKLVDSYLQSIQQSGASPSSSQTLALHSGLSPFLARCFYAISSFTQKSLRRALGPPPREHIRETLSPTHNSQSDVQQSGMAPLPGELDVMLPKVCEALVLVTQCLITIGLEAEEQRTWSDRPDIEANHKSDMKIYFNETRFQGQGLAESLIGESNFQDICYDRCYHLYRSPPAPG